ncbi:trifunctional purine biosynthetic protein adenosine-3 Gart [Lycorma delicatula]|uniref:trifunctional purine biosynthetic protein adenosine-3 Gart n=1 Tax=Lycorma delicatula TaxID=130591 RepID=UPI003F511929
MMNVLLLGSGGREHAISWKLSQSPQVKKLFVANGNAGICTLDKAEIIFLDLNNVKIVSDWCCSHCIDLVVVGPEAPLVSGIADSLKSNKIACFGPIKDAARIESDKSWSKSFMDKFNIPTGRWKSFNKRDNAVDFINSNIFNGYVVKASGLAAGKGVYVTNSVAEAVEAVDIILTKKKFGSAGNTVVIEEKLDGLEVSVLGFTDGSTIKIMLPAQDHKRIFDDDKGENTGGMGAYCPCPLITQEQLHWVNNYIMEPAIKGLKELGTPFVGVLYAGLMITNDGIKVLEFNCRFGDPETEVILPLLQTDLYTIMEACCCGKLDEINLEWNMSKSAVGVVMASKGYPESSSKGDDIKGIEEVDGKEGVIIFHCGTAAVDNQNGNYEQPHKYITNGGRVLAVVAVSDTLINAAARATYACTKINFTGAQYRSDIAHKGITRSVLQSGRLTYKHSGVDINAGDNFVNEIKSLAKSTNRSGVCGGLGGFGAIFDLKMIKSEVEYNDPLIVSSTDGVGTKLMIAEVCGNHTTIGIDLVAMCVNDILAQGAEPLFFLDYFATSKLDIHLAKNVISGIAEGCRQAGCALVGGETAEMPGLYSNNDYDLAGFAIGIVERDSLLPHLNAVSDGDIVIGLPSSGVHSNGFSLVRQIISKSGLNYDSPAPFSRNGFTIGDELLIPTKIYVNQVLPTLQKGLINCLAHITGGGLLENIPRVLPDNLKVSLDANTWYIPPVFAWLSMIGGVPELEMVRTFNCGIGLVLITSRNNKQKVLDMIPEASVIGTVNIRLTKEEPKVRILNFADALSPLMQQFVKPLVSRLTLCKRVAVLISGSGTNLQALIDGTFDCPFVQIVLVISNKQDAFGIKRAENANINCTVVKHNTYETRRQFEEVIDNLLNKNCVDIVCLAGFMRVLTGWFVHRWRGRLLNLHPSLLPSFKGAHAIRDAIAAQVRISGCTVHFVEEDIDAGCIIGQEAVLVKPDDTEQTLLERIHKAEHNLYPKSLILVACGKVKLDLSNNKLIWS